MAGNFERRLTAAVADIERRDRKLAEELRDVRGRRAPEAALELALPPRLERVRATEEREVDVGALVPRDHRAPHRPLGAIPAPAGPASRAEAWGGSDPVGRSDKRGQGD